MTDMTVAKTILAQIKTIDKWALGAWGAKDMVAGDNILQFKVNCPKLKHGKVRIEYEYGKDLYKVRFVKTRGVKFLVDETVENVYAEDLVNVIDNRVG